MRGRAQGSPQHLQPQASNAADAEGLFCLDSLTFYVGLVVEYLLVDRYVHVLCIKTTIFFKLGFLLSYKCDFF